MKKSDRYSHLFTSEYLMGPNSVRLLEEMLEAQPLESGMRVMDLGCGKGLTSLFLAKEAGVQIYATDLWISATENYDRFTQWQIADRAVPIHADANDLPYAEGYFDAIVSIDSFHYFATQPRFFEEKLLPLLRSGGVAILAMPGLAEEIHGREPEIIMEWLNGEESEYHLFHSRQWWLEHIGKSDLFEVVADFDLNSCDAAWRDWFKTGHEFALHDEKYYDRGISRYLSIVGLVIRKK